MHQYLDSDGSGTSETCVSSTIGAERLQAATQWLQANNLKGLLGEIGAGSNAACISAVQGALCEMQQSSVWLGALWWAAGPWWGDVSAMFPSVVVGREMLTSGGSTTRASSPRTARLLHRFSHRPSSRSCEAGANREIENAGELGWAGCCKTSISRNVRAVVSKYDASLS